MEASYSQHFPTTFSVCPGGSNLVSIFCSGSQYLTQELHFRCPEILHLGGGLIFKVWNEKTVTSTRRHPQNVGFYRIYFDLPANLWRCLNLNVASFAGRIRKPCSTPAVSHVASRGLMTMTLSHFNSLLNFFRNMFYNLREFLYGSFVLHFCFNFVGK